MFLPRFLVDSPPCFVIYQNPARNRQTFPHFTDQVLENIDHPYIVSLRFAFQTESKLYMFLDYFTGGELFFHLKQEGRFSEERAK